MQFLSHKTLLISMIWLAIGSIVLFLPLAPELEDQNKLANKIESYEHINLVQTLFNK